MTLTPLEFRLLQTLDPHRGRALDAQRLIDEAWGHATFVTDRVVDNQVTNLRKKIEPTRRSRGTSSASAASAIGSTDEA